VLRITDCDTTQASPLMAAEVQVVGVFGGTGLLAAGDFNQASRGGRRTVAERRGIVLIAIERQTRAYSFPERSHYRIPRQAACCRANQGPVPLLCCIHRPSQRQYPQCRAHGLRNVRRSPGRNLPKPSHRIVPPPPYFTAFLRVRWQASPSLFSQRPRSPGIPRAAEHACGTGQHPGHRAATVIPPG
jgi:hypothetical protein